MTAGPISISRDTARRFLALRHGLAPARALAPTPESVIGLVERLGYLQFDPLEVTGARNHDLVLHARIGGYRRELLDGLLYGQPRQLFELYNKSLNIVPLDQLPHHRISWQRTAEHYEQGVLREHADVAAAILGRLAIEGALSTADFGEHGHSVDWWWARTRVARAVLEALFVIGRVGIARRVGNRRYYDLIERLVPAHLLALSEPEEAAMQHRLLSRYRAVGLGSPSGHADLLYGTGDVAERRRRTVALVAAGKLAEVAVESLRGPRYVIADELAMLAAADGEPAGEPTAVLLAPLDPLVADRRLLRDLWQFDYVWEVYVPQAKRRWGYYVLPILFGERLVGRIEPRFDRRAGVLRVVGLWWEAGFEPRREEAFVPALRSALTDYLAFVGARRLEWASSIRATGRLIGKAVGRKEVST
jgi:uncharacterized protein YcaQ